MDERRRRVERTDGPEEPVGTGAAARLDLVRRVVELATESVEAGGGPFAALVVADGRVVGRGLNRVTAANDPTAHAEVEAIRDACRRLGSFQLTGCEVYCSCEPCPMCLGALYWARPARVYYALTREDAASAGFDDQAIYRELARPPSERRLPMTRIEVRGAEAPLERWRRLDDRVEY